MSDRRIPHGAWAGVLASVAVAVGVAAWVQQEATQPALPPGTVGSVDVPAGEALIGDAVRISGWALDPAGVSGVEIQLDGRRYPARYGLVRTDVADVKPGYPGAGHSGFEFDGALPPADAARREVAVVAINRAGTQTTLGRRSLIAPAALTQWQSLYDQRKPNAAPFYVLPGTSGISIGGAAELDTTYAPYASPTVKFGVRIPILYLRTTKGAAEDWAFDPDWNVDRRCGDRRIADDSLSAAMAHAVARRLPVLFTLNGGIWADASCDVPLWDVNDHLERDAANCQWNERNEAMPDDYLRNLPGSTSAPELARSLSLNVYAERNRFYKRRNLQAAGRAIAEFARGHPELFVGVNLDPDTYVNPFFEERQWYDYNPGTLRQFRHWLAATGPYAGKTNGAIPDLRAYRRPSPLTLAQVRALAGKPFGTWEAVDPPRAFPRTGRPFWEDAWTHEWEKFRRHLVDLHYDELSQWLAEAGVPRGRIFSSQGFMAPNAAEMPFALRLDSPTKNHDSGGMSVQGAVPVAGHLGAIVYGPSAVNEARMETGPNLFATFHRMAPGWGVVEFNTADLRAPATLPDYAMGYRALRDMWNYGARFASPMAWNGSNGIYAGHGGIHVVHGVAQHAARGGDARLRGQPRFRAAGIAPVDIRVAAACRHRWLDGRLRATLLPATVTSRYTRQPKRPRCCRPRISRWPEARRTCWWWASMPRRSRACVSMRARRTARGSSSRRCARRTSSPPPPQGCRCRYRGRPGWTLRTRSGSRCSWHSR